MKAADITDQQIFEAVDEIIQRTGGGVALIWDLWDKFPQFPPKVVRAKLSIMVRRGRLEGCECGKCRGDYKRLDKKGESE